MLQVLPIADYLARCCSVLHDSLLQLAITGLCPDRPPPGVPGSPPSSSPSPDFLSHIEVEVVNSKYRLEG